MDLSLQWPRAQAPAPATVAVPAAVGAVPPPHSSSNHHAQPSIYGAPPLSSQHHPDAYLYHAPPQPTQHHYVTHPAAYTSHQHPALCPNPNPNTYAYPYPDLNSATHIQSVTHAGQHLPDPYNHGTYASHGGHAALGASPYYYTGGEPAAVPAVPFNGHVGSATDGSAYAYDPLRGGTSLPPSYVRLESAASRMKLPRRKNKSSNLLNKKMLKVQKQATKVKVLQSAYCDACKIKCDTPEVLMLHKQGKKHKKNMQKLQESFVAKLKAPQPIVENEPAVAEKEKNTGEQKKKKHDPATVEDLEEKKRRLLEGGVAPKEIRICLICNVAVNSQKVYDYHIAGQKHASMLKKKQELAAV